jgi:hypothetical protein
MALHTFVAGDVLEAQQLNDSFAAVAGLTLISKTTIGSAVSSVNVTSAFSSTYDNYKITLVGGTGSVSDELIALKMGATTTGYYAGYSGANYTATASIVANNNTAAWLRAGGIDTDGLHMDIDLLGPNLAKQTFIMGWHVFDGSARAFAGFLAGTTQYTDFTLTPSNGTLTGGEIRVYGYRN